MSSTRVRPTDHGSSEPDEAASAEALETSGWGEKFTFVQPHNLCFWVYLALMAVGVFQAWSYFGPKIGFYANAFAVSAVLCALFGGAWWLWLRHVDRWERQPTGLVVAGVAWGAIAGDVRVRDDGQHRNARHLSQAVRAGLGSLVGGRVHRAASPRSRRSCADSSC